MQIRARQVNSPFLAGETGEYPTYFRPLAGSKPS